MRIFFCFGNMEGSYRQKYVYLAFILILLTSLLFSAFTHACHFIVFISMLITLIVFILYVVLNPVFVYSLRIRVNLHLHRFLTIIIFILENVYSQTMKCIKWRRIQVLWIQCRIMLPGSSVSATISAT